MAYPKNRVPSKLAPCEFCGKMCHERGLKNHIRLKHKLKVTTQVTKIEERTFTPSGNSSKTPGNSSKDNSSNKSLGGAMDDAINVAINQDFAKQPFDLLAWQVANKKKCSNCGYVFLPPLTIAETHGSCCSAECLQEIRAARDAALEERKAKYGHTDSPFTKWYVRGVHGEDLDKEFDTKEEALKFIKMNIKANKGR